MTVLVNFSHWDNSSHWQSTGLSMLKKLIWNQVFIAVTPYVFWLKVCFQIDWCLNPVNKK